MAPPYHPISGDQSNLRQDGTAPYCAMMQVAAADTYDDYVICRGFDPRILRFIDYEAGNADKPGISVAKPYGKRMTDTYQIAEIYPALLPTQGNSGFDDFRQVVYTPPSPVDVLWRVGQNPGVVNVGGLANGHPGSLSDEIEILYDHNGKVVNWLLIDGGGGGGTGDMAQGTLDSIATAGAASPYNGLVVGTITVVVAPCDQPELIDTQIDVVDWSGCIFDLAIEDLQDVWVWTATGIADSRAAGAEEGTLTDCHWTAVNRCCVAADLESIDGGTA